jgi:hypothetical protein
MAILAAFNFKISDEPDAEQPPEMPVAAAPFETALRASSG